MESREYLLCYGKAGDFGRFQAQQPVPYQRGQRLVIQSQRGEELGVVMRPAGPGHAPLLAGQYVGKILRAALDADLDWAGRLQVQSDGLFVTARQLALDQVLPVEVLDAEILLDGRQGVLYCLKPPDLELAAYMETLAVTVGLELRLRDLALPVNEDSAAAEGGCGEPNCGGGSGSCGSCVSGACSTCVLHHAAVQQANRV
jgi:hypothetical protein